MVAMALAGYAAKAGLDRHPAVLGPGELERYLDNPVSRPGLLVLDATSVRQDLRAWFARLREKLVSVPVLVVCEGFDQSSFERLIEAGADGLLALDSSDADIVSALKTVAGGGNVTSADHASVANDRTYGARESDARRAGTGAGSDPLDSLTSRQQDVLDGLLAGYSNKQIARELDISPHTVNMHLRSIFRLLNVHTRMEAISAVHQRIAASQSVPLPHNMRREDQPRRRDIHQRSFAFPDCYTL